MPTDYHNHDDWHWIVDTPISNPMSGYAKYSGSRASWGIDALGTVVAEVELEDGTVGVGPSIGGNPACHIIEHHLSRFVEGQDVRNTNLMWDQMYRATMPYGRKVGRGVPGWLSQSGITPPPHRRVFRSTPFPRLTWPSGTRLESGDASRSTR